MKNILVPTDFSACAAHAIDAAYKLARKFDSTVHLLHVITDSKASANESEWNQAIDNATVLLRKFSAEHPDVETIPLTATGKLLKVLEQYVSAHGIDLVVMGSHGASGKQEYFIGSNTQKAVRSIFSNVLIVKDRIEDVNFDKVVFASNFNQTERDAFMKFKEFIKHFIPEIHLVMVHTSSLFDPPYVVSQEAMKDFQALCEPFESHIHIYRDFTIEKGVRTFAEDVGAKLIAVSNHYRHPLKRMLIGSNVEALINHSHLPVLSIDYLERK
jgi:nucleotide-binding universal stress UspA family protein